MPDVLKGVDGLVVLSDLVMDMWSRGASSAAGVAYLVAPLDALSCFDGDLGEVTVASGDPVAVIDNDQISIPCIGSRPDYQAIRGR